MKIFLVTVRPGNMRTRYFDSIWISEAHAQDRLSQLRDEFERVGFPVYRRNTVMPEDWHVVVTLAYANDGQIADETLPKVGRQPGAEQTK